MDFSWAQSYPDLHKICTLFQMTELVNPIKFKYKMLQQFLQDGPQCGLIALAMCIGNPTKESVEKLYVSAKNHSFTYNGEMFSVREMADLAKEHLPSETEIEVHNGSLDSDFIQTFLLNGGIMLVPYPLQYLMI